MRLLAWITWLGAATATHILLQSDVKMPPRMQQTVRDVFRPATRLAPHVMTPLQVIARDLHGTHVVTTRLFTEDGFYTSAIGRGPVFKYACMQSCARALESVRHRDALTEGLSIRLPLKHCTVLDDDDHP